MIKVIFYMNDFSKLNDSILFKGNNINNGHISSKEEAEQLIQNEKGLYFSTNHIQGTLIPNKIKNYLIYDDENKVKYIKETISTRLTYGKIYQIVSTWGSFGDYVVIDDNGNLFQVFKHWFEDVTLDCN
jgi:hypothetical protein